MATRIGIEGTEVLAQDLPNDVQLGSPGSDAKLITAWVNCLKSLKVRILI